MSNLILKLDNKSQTFKRTIPRTEVGNDIRFTSAINTGFGQLTFRYQKEAENSNIVHTDLVKIIDPDTNITIYSGIVNTITRVIEERNEYIDVQCLGLQAMMRYTLYQYSASYTFTRTADPATIIKEILDLFPTHFSYTGVTIPNYGSNVSISFDYTTCLDAIKKVLDVTGWGLRYDGDGVVYFFNKTTITNADHTIVFQKHIAQLEQKEESSELYNDITVKYSGGSTVNVTDSTSITAYGTRKKYISDTTLNDSTTATAYANAFLADNKDPKKNIGILVTPEYSMSTIKAGQSVAVVGDPFSIGSKRIEKLEYTSDGVYVSVSDVESLEKFLSQL